MRFSRSYNFYLFTKKLTETARKIGIPPSAEEIMGKVADKIVTSNYEMMHAVSRTNNSVTYKSPKTLSSKSKTDVGLSSGSIY